MGSSGSRFPTHYPNIKANIFILGCHLSAGQAMPSGLSACRSVRSSSLNMVNLGQRAFRNSYSANIWRESWHRGNVLSLGIQHYQYMVMLIYVDILCCLYIGSAIPGSSERLIPAPLLSPAVFFIAGVSVFLVGNNWAATALYRIRGETLRHLLELLKHL